MKSFKKIWRGICLVLLLSLALVGIGAAGGIPVPPSNRKENQIEINVERIDDQDDESEEKCFI